MIKHFADIRLGEKSCWYGRKHTEETRRKMSEAQSGEKHSMWGKKRTQESREKQSKAVRGEKSYLWRGSHIKRKLPNYVRKEIILRDDATCKLCGYSDKTNHVHHINHDNTDHRRENLITLCQPCHSKETNYYGRDSDWMRHAELVINEWITLCEN